MNKKILLLFTTMLLLACNFLFPPKSTATPEDVFQTTGFTIVRLHPNEGNLNAMLADHVQKARALNQLPVVEFDATWCPPCQAIDRAIKGKDELMFKAYTGTYIIKLDVDEWGWNNGKVQDFRFEAIPVYFKLDAQGHQTGEVIDGGAWGEDIPQNIAPVMDRFFHGG
jgi:thiol-disulfide isomerase/thioredoxin